MALLDDVMSRVRPVKCSKSWHDKLPADVAAEADALREQYRVGTLGDTNATRLAVALIESLAERGFKMPRPRQVVEWLNEKA